MPAAYEVTVIIFKYILLSLFKKKNNPQRQVKEKILKTSFLLLFSR